jgi:transposase
MHYEFLPPYSLDFNPIELLFSAMKYCLCQNGSYICFTKTELTNEEVMFTLNKALYQSMPQ